jgi:hypothetical protein
MSPGFFRAVIPSEAAIQVFIVSLDSRPCGNDASFFIHPVPERDSLL